MVLALKARGLATEMKEVNANMQINSSNQTEVAYHLSFFVLW